MFPKIPSKKRKGCHYVTYKLEHEVQEYRFETRNGTSIKCFSAEFHGTNKDTQFVMQFYCSRIHVFSRRQEQVVKVYYYGRTLMRSSTAGFLVR